MNKSFNLSTTIDPELDFVYFLSMTRKECVFENYLTLFENVIYCLSEHFAKSVLKLPIGPSKGPEFP